MKGIRLYCGVNEVKWDGKPVSPGPYACISPVYGSTARTRRINSVNVPQDTVVLQDSGAFSDGPGERLSFQEALDRQIEHSERYGYSVSHRASYDLLIDEMWVDGRRKKRRWSESDAERAVDETIRAARFMKESYDGPAVLSVQGVTPSQYVVCAKEIVPMIEDGDVLGLGGWCISGKYPAQMRAPFNLTMNRLIPYVANAGVIRVHIWGVMDSRFLGPLLFLCDQWGVQLSTDSSGPQLRPKRGVWGYMGWKNRGYEKPKDNMAVHRVMHVKIARAWLRCGLRNSEFYKEPKIIHEQAELGV